MVNPLQNIQKDNEQVIIQSDLHKGLCCIAYCRRNLSICRFSDHQNIITKLNISFNIGIHL